MQSKIMRHHSLPAELANAKNNYNILCWQRYSWQHCDWYSPTEKQFGNMYRKWEKNVPTHWPSEITFGKLFFKNNWEHEKNKAFNIKMLILALSTIMKNWKQSREPWEKDGRFPLTASNCWNESSPHWARCQMTVLWWKSPSLQVLSFLIFPPLL